MRLLDVHQLTLKSFLSENDRPQYAILSHTWGDEEVTFQDLTKPDVESMKGYAKIQKCCEEAISYGLDYAWIDTCCIDKTSSAELSEAINSMYKWYQAATICFAYLSDVEGGENLDDSIESELFESRWFTRGWTLQELLAPQAVLFYNHYWTEIGTRETLFDTISLITDIPVGVLLKNVKIDAMSIAQRMSWAAKRETTRTEDIAYCLMGIFDVNMPTLYGEGEKAFIRLQHEIMKFSDDHSLFAWSLPHYNDDVEMESGLLSPSPRYFQQGRVITQTENNTGKQPFSITNQGIHVWLPLETPKRWMGTGMYQAVLDCKVSDRKNSNLSIYLREKTYLGHGQYSRIQYRDDTVDVVNEFNRGDSTPQEIFVKDMEPRVAFQSPFEDGILNMIATHYRFHLSNAPASKKFGYRILSSSVDSTPDFMDLGYCDSRGQCALSKCGYFFVCAKADPSIQALIALGVPSHTLDMANLNSRAYVDVWATGQRELCRLASPSPDDWRVLQMLIAQEHHVATVTQSEMILVIDLENGWKLSVSLQRGPITSNLAQHPQHITQAHFRVAIVFINPHRRSQDSISASIQPVVEDPSTRTRHSDAIITMPRITGTSQMYESSVSFPQVTVFVKPESFGQIWEDHVRNREINSLHSMPSPLSAFQNHFNGVTFCSPQLHWEKIGIEDEGWMYKWTPTFLQMRAVVELGVRKDAASAVLELVVEDDFTVRPSLRLPLNADLDEYPEDHLTNFVVTDLPRRDSLCVSGPILRVEIKGL